VEILDIKWTPLVNMMYIKCDCGIRFWHRADRWKVYCRFCKRWENIIELRNNWVGRWSNKDYGSE